MASTTKQIEKSKDVFDATLDLYGSIDYLFNTIDDNGIGSVEETVIVGTMLNYDDELVFLAPAVEEGVEESLIKSYTIKQDQDLFDLAIQLYGDVQYLFSITDANHELFTLNNTQEFTGLSIAYAEQSFAVTNHFRKNRIIISTAFGDTDLSRAFDDSFDLSFG